MMKMMKITLITALVLSVIIGCSLSLTHRKDGLDFTITKKGQNNEQEKTNSNY